jgi:hypothetical protein
MRRPPIVLAAVIACAACAPASSTAPAGPAPSTAAASAQVSLSAGGQPQAPGGTAPATLGIAWDDASKAAALATATKAMALYARPTAPAVTWMQDLGQLMTPQAAADYQDTDPAAIPATRITGPAQLKADPGNGYGCHALIPTDAGTYDIQLLRSAADAPWQVNRITPPNTAEQ